MTPTMEPSKSNLRISFGSDNHAPVHPDVLAAIVQANQGFADPYGDDPTTQEAQELFRRAFGPSAQAFFVPTGTMANALALAAMAPLRGQAVYCADRAHVNTREAGAVEALGIKLLPMPSKDGLLDLADLKRRLQTPQGVHEADAVGVSLSVPSEYGTIYDDAAILDISETSRVDGGPVYVHIDGARIFTAITDALSDADGLEGIRRIVDLYRADVVSVGLTKIGGMDTDAIVCRDPKLADNLARLVKRQGGLRSKQRFAAAQAIALLKPDDDGKPLALKLARHACAMAEVLKRKLKHVPDATVAIAVEANMVFAAVPPDWVAPLHTRFGIHAMGAPNQVRMVCSWATTPDHVDALVDFLRNGCKDS